MPDDVTEAVRAAFEKHSAPAAEPAAPAPAPAPSTPPPAQSAPVPADTGGSPTAVPLEASATGSVSRSRDEAGRFAKGSTEKPAPEKAVTTETQPAEPGETTGTPPPAPGTTTETLKPPQSWTPEEREGWSTMSPKAQKAAVRIDAEVRKTLQETAEARKGYEAFKTATAPFDAFFRAEGVEPLRAVQSVMPLLQSIRHGTPEQAGQAIAMLIKNGRATVETIASALDSAPAQQAPAFDPSQVQTLVQQQLQQMLAPVFEQNKQRTETEMRSKFEHYDRVRESMDKLVAAQLATAGEDAYRKAIQLDSELAAAEQQKQAAKAAANAQASTSAARAAEKSVKPQPAVPLNGAKSVTVEDTIRAAIRKHANR